MARRNWTPESDAYVDRRIGEGATYAVIGRELGVTAATISGRLYRRKRDPDPAKSDQAAAADALRTLEQSLGYERATQPGCRWVIGAPPEAWRWCGEPIVEGPYCAEHAARSKSQRGDIKR
jgi:hypothetical protein